MEPKITEVAGQIRAVLIIVLIAFFLFFAVDACADPVKVVVHEFKPCVMKIDGKYTGFDIDIWEAVAKQAGIEFEYVEAQNFKDIFNKVNGIDGQLAVAGITINGEREKDYDFSHRYLDAGLRILVQKKEPNQEIQYWNYIEPLLLFIGFILLVAHIMYFSERGENAIDDQYTVGIWQAIYFCIVTSSTVGYGDITPKKPLGKFCTSLLIIVGIIVFGLFIAKLSADYTVSKVNYKIKSPKDLKGALVATKAGTTSAKAVREYGGHLMEVAKIEEAYALLELGKVEAVVFDVPSIDYYVNNNPSGKVIQIGEIFHYEYYGMMMPNGSDLRERINLALLEIEENGTYDRIFNKWFGR